MADNFGVYNISGRVETMATSSYATALEPPSGNINLRRGPERELYKKILLGQALKSDVGEAAITMPNQGMTVDANTVALWRVDEPLSSSNLVDEVGGRVVQVFGSTVPPNVTGQVGYARFVSSSQTGLGQWLQGVGDATLGTTFSGSAWSIETWINPSAEVTGQLIFIYNGLNFSIDDNHLILAQFGYFPTGSTGRLGFTQWTDPGNAPAYYSSGTIASGSWSHVALTRERQVGGTPNRYTFKMYINGQLDTEIANVVGQLVSTSGSGHFVGFGGFIGSSGFGTPSGGPFVGKMDELRISNVVRTSAQILESYQRGTGSLPQYATVPSWTQTPGTKKRHAFVISELSSSAHESTSANAKFSGTQVLESTAVPATDDLYYSKQSRFVKVTYALTASADLPPRYWDQNLANLVGTALLTASSYEYPTGSVDGTGSMRAGVTSVVTNIDGVDSRNIFHPVSGAYRAGSVMNPALFDIDVPDYGRIRDLRVWVEFIHDVRGPGTAGVNTTFDRGGDGIPASVASDRMGLGSVVVALKSPNVRFKYAHPLWNDPGVAGQTYRPALSDLGSVQQGYVTATLGTTGITPPPIYRDSYLLWEGSQAWDTWRYASNAPTASLGTAAWTRDDVASSIGAQNPKIFTDRVGGQTYIVACSGATSGPLEFYGSGAFLGSSTYSWRKNQIATGSGTAFAAAYDPIFRRMHATWLDTNDGQIFHAFSGTTSWVRNAFATTNNGNNFCLTMCTDNQGRAHVFTYASSTTSGGALIHYVSASNGKTTEEIPGFVGSPNRDLFACVADEDGNLHLNFGEYLGDGTLNLYHVMSGSTTGWNQVLVGTYGSPSTAPLNFGYISSRLVTKGRTLAWSLIPFLNSATPISLPILLVKNLDDTSSITSTSLLPTQTGGLFNTLYDGWRVPIDIFGQLFGAGFGALAGLYQYLVSDIILDDNGELHLTSCANDFSAGLQGSLFTHARTHDLKLTMVGTTGSWEAGVVSRQIVSGGLANGSNPGHSFWVYANSALDRNALVNTVTQRQGINSGSAQYTFGLTVFREQSLGQANAIPTWDRDKDMRTIFTDSSTYANPRGMSNIFPNRSIRDSGNALAVGNRMLDESSYASPMSGVLPRISRTYALSTNYGGFQYRNPLSMTGSNWPWMVDSRIPPGNATGRSISFGTNSPPAGWLTGPGGTNAANEFNTSGSTLGPNTIRPVYPILDDVYMEKVYDANTTDLIKGRRVVGFRPGLRGTEVNGKWRLMIGGMWDTNLTTSSNGWGENPLGRIWFRQLRLEFLIDTGRGIVDTYASKGRRFKQSNLHVRRDGVVDVVSGTANWDVGVSTIRVGNVGRDEYGRSVGITDSSGTADFAVYTRITGALATALSSSGRYGSVQGSFLMNEFGTPFIPISSGSGVSPSFDPFTSEDASEARQTFQEVLVPTTLVPRDNTLRAFLARSKAALSTRDAVVVRLKK